MLIQSKLLFVKLNRNYALIFIILLGFIFCIGINVSSNEFNYSFDIKIDSNAFSIYKLYNEDFLSPNIIMNENIHLNWEHKYDIVLSGSPDLYFGYFKRYEREVRAGKDVIRFIDDYNNNELKDNYKVKFETWSQLLDGIYIGTELYRNIDYGVSIDFYGKLLRGLNLERSYYSGNIYLENEDIEIKALRNSIYSFVGEDTKLYDVNFYSQGYSFDINILWEIDDKQSLALDIKDLYSRLYWYDVYTKVGEYDTDNIEIEDDHLKYVPSFQGKFYYDDYLSYLTPDIDLSYKGYDFEMGVNYQYSIKPYLNFEVINNDPFSLYMGFYGDQYTTNIKYSAVDIVLITDDFDFKSSKSIMGKMVIGFSF